MNTDHYNASRLGLDPPHFELRSNQEKGASAMQPEHSVKPDQDVLFAWHECLDEAAPSQDAKQQLLQREGELLPRFAEHYDDLTHLPRSMRRRLQRHWKRSLAGVALLLALGQAPAMAATINVGSACTLVRAIVAANNNTTATGHCKKGSGADTIVMPAKSTQTLTAINNFVYEPTGLPVIRSVVTIAGNGSTIRRASNAPAFRIFAVSEAGNLALQGTTVTGGLANPVAGVDKSGAGGGLLNYGGKLTLSNCTVSGNRARSGGGLAGYSVSNPAGEDTTTTLNNSTISGNSAAFGGGASIHGLLSYVSKLYITNSIVASNRAVKDGGGVYARDFGSITITNSTVSGNVASRGGGGVFGDYASTSLTKSTISGNRAGGSGGGVTNTGDSGFRATNSTISGNTAKQGGGGLFNGGMSFAELTHTTISRNNGGTRGGGIFSFRSTGLVFLRGSLISGNTAFSGREIFYDNSPFIGGGIIPDAVGFNVFGHSGLTNAQAFVRFTPGATDITATSNGNRTTALNRILNTTLANNGGPTKTHALVAGSPAVDAVNDGTCPPPARDQRGVRRPRDGNGDGGPACDVGSVER